jgi:hypothetical protein
VQISWDEAKNLSNQEKRGLSFEQGAALFGSGRVYEIYDGMYENQEQRFIAFGEISSGVIGVVFAEYDDDHVRIISVRPATRSEVHEYQKYMDTLS